MTWTALTGKVTYILQKVINFTEYLICSWDLKATWIYNDFMFAGKFFLTPKSRFISNNYFNRINKSIFIFKCHFHFNSIFIFNSPFSLDKGKYKVFWPVCRLKRDIGWCQNCTKTLSLQDIFKFLTETNNFVLPISFVFKNEFSAR